MKFSAPPGTPACTHAVCSFRPVSGALLVGLNTTVFPVRSAAETIPAARTSGKLNGEIIAHTPYGCMVLMLRSPVTSDNGTVKPPTPS